MAQGTCSIPDCGRPAETMGWCQAHYVRYRKTGDVQAERPIEERRPRADGGGPCAILDCTKPATKRGWCQAHYQRWRIHGDPLHSGPLRPKSPSGDVPRYASVHHNLRLVRGRASEHACVDCGSPAAQWSYREGEASQCIVEVDGWVRRYSVDPDDYDPRCAPCHRTFDAEARRRA